MRRQLGEWSSSVLRETCKLYLLSTLPQGFKVSDEADNPRSVRPKNAFSLLKVLADSFGKAYLETALDTCVLIQSVPFDARS